MIIYILKEEVKLTMNIYYFMISEGQESKNSLARYFWPRVSHEVAVKLSVRAANPEGLVVAGGSNSKKSQISVLNHMAFSTKFLVM